MDANTQTTTEPLSVIKLRCNKDLAIQQDQPFMNLSPSFQRSYEAWTIKLRTKLIETVMLGRAMNPIWIVHNVNGDEDVLDGMHRLTTLLRFMDNETTIGVMTNPRLQHLSGKKFSDFSSDEKAKFRNYNITINRLDSSYSKDPSKLMEMWELLNKSSKPLNLYEYSKPVRKTLYDLVENFLENHVFLRTVVYAGKSAKRGTLTQTILQMVALTEERLERFSSLENNLDKWVEKKLGSTGQEIEDSVRRRSRSLLDKCKRIYDVMVYLTEQGVFSNKTRGSVAIKIIITRCVAKMSARCWEENKNRIAPLLHQLLNRKDLHRFLGCATAHNNSTYQKKLINHTDHMIDQFLGRQGEEEDA